MTLSSGAPLQRAAAARTCQHPECTTTLSRYNPDATCARHGGWIAEAPPRRRRRRAEMDARAAPIRMEDEGVMLDADVDIEV